MKLLAMGHVTGGTHSTVARFPKFADRTVPKVTVGAFGAFSGLLPFVASGFVWFTGWRSAAFGTRSLSCRTALSVSLL